MFQFKRDFEQRFRAPRDVEAARRLFPQLQSFEQWLQKNREAFATETVAAAVGLSCPRGLPDSRAVPPT